MFVRPILCVLLLFGLTAATHAGDLETIEQLERESNVATWTRDTAWFEENLANDYVRITPVGAVQTKREVIRSLLMPGVRMEPYEADEVSVRIYGNAAVVTGRILQRITVGRKRFSNDLRYTGVYAKRKNRWLLVSSHISNADSSR